MTDHEFLSLREVEILELVATGASNKEIADSLVISVNTVKVHLKNIYGKLGVNTRTEAALFAIKNNIFQVQGITANTATTVDPRNDITETRLSRGPDTWNITLAMVGMLLLASVGIYILLKTDDTANVPDQNTSAVERFRILNDLPTPRSGLAVVSYENQIYAIAGESEFEVTGIVQRYDPTTNQWNDLPSKPTPVKDVSAGIVGGLIFIPGGILESGQPTSVLEVFDPRDGTWSARAPLPVHIGGYSLATFEGSIYTFGGWDGEEYVDLTFSYDPRTDTWTTLTPMPTARGYGGASIAGEEVFVIGGFDGSSILAANEIYSPNSDNPAGNPWRSGEPLPEARYGMGVATVADIIHVIAGKGEENSQMSFKYLPSKNEWTFFSTPISDEWYFLGLAPIQTELHLMGGTLDGKISGRNVAYRALYSVLLPMVE